MPASFEEILDSRVFKFTVGQKIDGVATTFSVHEQAIAALSQPLHSLMRSGLSESQAGHATWEEVSKDTFVRFAQFAYTGDYSVPVPTIPDSQPDASVVEEAYEPCKDQANDLPDSNDNGLFVNDFEGWGISKSRSTTNKSKKKLLQKEQGFASILTPLVALRDNYEGTCEPSGTFQAGMEYSGVFISHASLWNLGNYRQIESLKALSLYKIHKTLCAFQLSSSNVHAVVDLLKYAYLQEGAGLGEEISALRKLVCRYLGLHKALLSEDDGFMDLLGEGGQFVKDFFKYSSE